MIKGSRSVGALTAPARPPSTGSTGGGSVRLPRASGATVKRPLVLEDIDSLAQAHSASEPQRSFIGATSASSPGTVARLPSADTAAMVQAGAREGWVAQARGAGGGGGARLPTPKSGSRPLTPGSQLSSRPDTAASEGTFVIAEHDSSSLPAVPRSKGGVHSNGGSGAIMAPGGFVISPYDENQKLRKELAQHKKLLRQLEAELRRLAPRMADVAAAYAPPAVAAGVQTGAPAGPSMEELQRQLARQTERARMLEVGHGAEAESAKRAAAEEAEALRHQMAAEIKRARATAEHQLSATQAAHAREAAEAAASAMAREEAAKRERVELLRRQIGRRMMNRSLTMGWSAWVELWQAKVYALKKLREVANRLQKPQLSSAFYFWANELAEQERAKERARLEAEMDAMSKSLEGQLREAKFQVDQLKLVRTSREEEVSALKEQLGRAKAESDAKTAELSQAAELFNEMDGVRTALAAAEERASIAESRLGEADGDVASQRQANQELLERLLAEQRAKFEKEEARLKSLVSAKSEAEQAKMAKMNAELQKRSEAKAKEERIEMLRRQIGRRMLNRSLTMGWSAWVERWLAKLDALARLKRCAARLQSPGIAASFFTWHESWRDAKLAKLATDAAAYEALQTQLQLAQEELEAVMADRRALREQLSRLDGGVAEAERLREEALANAKAERVELLRRQVSRRMMNSGLANCWMAWHDFWAAKTYAMRRLREVGNRLRTPGLSLAFDAWYEEWADALAAKEAAAQRSATAQLQASLEEAVAELEHTRVMYEAKLAAMAEERRNALERQLLEMSGSAEEVVALREQQAKERRVEHFQQRSSRRMLHRELAGGWDAWFNFVTAKVAAMSALRDVANKLRAPDLAHAFNSWVRDWVEAKAELAAAEASARGSELERVRAELTEQLDAARATFEAQLAVAQEDKRRALEKQMLELSGSSEELAALREAQDKERRVEQIRVRSLKKMANRALGSGWTAWHEGWEARTYTLNRLREIGRRLRAPELAHAFSFWVSDWEATLREAAAEKERMEAEKRRETLAGQLRQAQFDADQLRLVRTAHESELKMLRESLQEAKDAAIAREAQLAAHEALESENAELKARLGISEGSMGSRKDARDSIYAEEAKKRKANQELLEKLLDEQRSKFGEANRAQGSRTQCTLSALAESALREQLDQATAEHEERAAALQQVLDARAKALSSVEGELATLRMEMNRQREKAERELAGVQAAAKQAEAALKAEVDKHKKEITRLTDKKKTKKPPAKSILNLDLDESPGAPPISEQLKDGLRKHAVRVLDLFRSWDADGDGEVTRKEFHRAMPALGLEVPKEAIDDLFSEWDKDGGGALNLGELQKILRAPRSPTKKAEEVKVGGKAVMAASRLARTGSAVSGRSRSPGESQGSMSP